MPIVRSQELRGKDHPDRELLPPRVITRLEVERLQERHADNEWTPAQVVTGDLVYSVSGGGKLWQWDLDATRWADQACLVANRTLTQAEWELSSPTSSSTLPAGTEGRRRRRAVATARGPVPGRFTPTPYWLKPLAQPILRWLLERATRKNLETLARLAEERSAAT